jgi:serine/threonine-protein kinase
MGVLYLARRAGTSGFSRPVAIKVIHDHLAANSRFCRMFIDEAKLSARIDDPNVVRVEEFGQADGRYYLVMEYVHGASLAQTIAVLRKRGGIPIELAVAIAMQIGSGLHGAHEATDEDGTPLGIVHRDVSPHNVIVSFKGYVRVIDFGIAKAKQVGGQTKTGSLRGKLAYMPPEQARSARTVDRRADLYGVGLILWEMLTFRRVFDADTDIAILNQIRNPEILAPSKLAPAVPRALDDIVMRTLANEPGERPATGAALVRALAEAVPAAARVTQGDLSALMSKVRAAAEAAAASKGDDPSALYGEEVRGTLRTFGANMSESIGTADVVDTRPTSPEPGEDNAPGSGGRAQAISAVPPPPSAARPPQRMPTMRMTPGDDEALTAKRQAPARPSGPPMVRPSDGVRALVPVPPGSSPDLLIPPPPLSSSRGLLAVPSSPSEVARASYVDVRPSMPSPLEAAPPSHPGHAGEAGTAALTQREKLMIVVGAPVIVAMAIGFVLMAGGRNAAPASAAVAPARDAAASSARPAAKAAEAPALVAAVVIAPPEPVEEAVDGGAVARPKKPLVRSDEDPVALLLQEGGPVRARRILEERGVDKLSIEELKVLRAICKSQKDAACVSRVTVVMDRR